MLKSFEKSIYLGIFSSLILLIGVVSFSFISFRKIVNQRRQIIEINYRELLLAEKLVIDAASEDSLAPMLVLSGDLDFVVKMEEAHNRFEQRIQELKSIVKDKPSEELIEQLLDADRNLHVVALQGVNMSKQGHSSKDIHDFFEKHGASLSARRTELLNQLVEYKRAATENTKSSMYATSNALFVALIITSLVSIILVGVLSVLQVYLVRQKRMRDQQRAKLNRQTQRLSQLRKETMEVVAHDLRNPLSAVKLSLLLINEMSNEGNLADPVVSKHINIASRSVVAMETLISNLLDHSKIETGTLQLEKHLGDFAGFVRQQLQPLNLIAEQKRITLHYVGPEELTATFDPERMGQVISNVIGNALKFTPAQGEVSVSIEREQQSIILRIIDSGPGIKEGDEERIFDRYRHGEDNRCAGTGLGLAIAKGIMEAHGGGIYVRNNLDKGCTFTISFPADEA